jgi:hypothetical protein
VLSSLAVLLASSTPAMSQWSDNPANPLVIADRSGEQVQSKLVATGDGGFYVSWFDSSNGYGVWLQRLDAGGNEQWAHNGVLVAARDFSSTQDYGLDIDATGNALLTFRYHDGNGIAQIVAQKIAPSGNLLWASPGVQVSADVDDANSPRITRTGDGNVVVAWSSSTGALRLQKLDPAGAPLWVAGGIAVNPPSGFFFLADLHGDAAGNAIASWSAQLSFFDRQLWTQKFAAADGAVLWGATPVKVFDGVGGAMQLGNFPPFIADGAGGAVFVWYTVGVSAGSVRVQHIDAAGVAAFAQNGVLASADSAQSHTGPSGAYDAASGDIYALWRETDIATQGQIGVYAQRIDSAGARQWGSGGKVLVPLGSADQGQLVALPFAGGLLAALASNSAPTPMPIHVARLSSDGNYVWPGNVIDISSLPSDVGRLAGAVGSDGFAAFTWTAAAASFAGDIRAQNINADGSLGISGVIYRNGFE